ncbi:uncharacterized protein LOC116296830 [Actinia tenebrosa]|uniref:Uncharacterized protein LOC116296830 n=1 Tax=Actinia tenebrosa TaxID=6105 RepID=A0A6P8I7W4_ACTTE|nr:uncharacterized protein LOC116296830 [Actinia tenebrosa]
MNTSWIYLLGVLLFFVPSLNANNAAGGRVGDWTKMSLMPVCFEGRNNRYGHFVNMGESKLVAAIKLVYKSGKIRCVSNVAYDSRWGCHHYSSFVNYPLNVVITDQEDNVIYPASKYFKTSNLWYYLPGTDDLLSDELVFVNYGTPFYLEQYRQLRVWYGEDLKNSAEGDNQGRVCVDVYAKFYD